MGSFLGLRMPSSLTAPLVGASAGRMAPVVTAAGFSVAPQFGYVVLTASASAILTQWQMLQVCDVWVLGFGISFFEVSSFVYVVVDVSRV